MKKKATIIPVGKNARAEKLYPEYLQAVEDFLKSNHTEGEILTHEWLDEHLDLRPGTQGYQLRKMSRVQGFRRELLEKHQIDLKNVLGKGYYIVPAVEQTATAMRDARHRVDRAFTDSLSRCINIRHELLTDAQKEANQKAIGILAAMKTQNSRSLSTRKITAKPAQDKKAIPEPAKRAAGLKATK